MKKDAAAGLSRLLLNELGMTALGYSRKLLFESFICGALLLSGRGSSETEEGPRYDCAWTDSCCAGAVAPQTATRYGFLGVNGEELGI